MTVEVATARVTYTGSGTTGPFTIPFYFIANGDIRAIKTLISDGTETELTLTTDFTLTGAGDEDGGELTLVASLSSSYRLTIFRDPDILQETDYPANDAFPSTSHEQALDLLTMVAQRHKDRLDRTLQQPEGDSTAINRLPAKVDRASKYLAFNAAGDPVSSEGTGTDSGLRADLAATGGAGLMGWIYAAASAVAATVQNWVNWQKLNVFGFMSVSEIADVQAGTLLVDVTSKIGAANTAATADSKTLYFPKGTYKYAPSARLDIEVDWEGENVHDTIISCETGSYTDEFFRVAGPYSMRCMAVQTNGLTKLGTGIRLANTDVDSFTGNLRLGPRLTVKGFKYNIRPENVYMIVYDQVRSQDGEEGLYCAPADNAGDNGYVNSHLFLGSYFNGNDRNIYFAPAINSNVVCFVGGASEAATGAVAQNDFTNIRELSFQGFYIEGADGIPAIKLNNCLTTVDGLHLLDCGSVSLGTAANSLTMRRVYTSGASAVISATGGANVQNITLDQCEFPSSGNTISADNVVLINTTINGKHHIHTVANQDSTGTALTSGVAGDVYSIVVPESDYASLAFDYALSVVTGGVTRQCNSGRVQVSAARVTTGTPTVAITHVGSTDALATGTLSVSFSVTAAADGTVTVQCTATTSLGTPTISIRLMSMTMGGIVAIT
jgi:hypothetical protein